jgi:SAM-dependent methyltransferase
MNHAWDADEYDARFSFVTAYGAALVDLLDPAEGERVLDVGCGTGHLCAELADRGAEVVGLDADESMLASARAAHGAAEGLRFVAGDAMAFGPDDVGGTFDAAMSNAALHWMTRPQDVLACVRSVLRPGGRFVAEMGGAGNVERVREAIVAGVAAVAGISSDEVRGQMEALSYFPTPGQQACALEDAGFDVVQLWSFARPTPLEGSVFDWAKHFRPDILALAGGGGEDELRAAVDREAQQRGLQQDGQWLADYVRLRFVAVAA